MKIDDEQRVQEPEEAPVDDEMPGTKDCDRLVAEATAATNGPKDDARESMKDGERSEQKKSARVQTKVSEAGKSISVKDRRMILAHMQKLMASGGENAVKEVRASMNSYTTLNSRQKDAVLKPLTEFHEKSRKNWSEMGMSTWWPTILEVLCETEIESGEMLAEYLTEAGASVQEANETAEELARVKLQLEKLSANTKMSEEAVRLQEQCELLQTELNETKRRAADRFAEVQKENARLRKENEQVDQMLEEIDRLKQDVKKEKLRVEKFRAEKHLLEGKSEKEDEKPKLVGLQFGVLKQKVQRKSSESFWTASRKSSSPSPMLRSQRRGERRESRERARQEDEAWDKVEQWRRNSYESEHRSEREVAGVHDHESISEGSRVSSVHVAMNYMAEMMRLNTLPDPKPFDGSGSLTDFERTFLNKFEAVTRKDEDSIALLEQSYLKGTAKTLFLSVPNFRKKKINQVFKELKAKLDKRLGDRVLQATETYDRLEKKPDQSMWEYCVEIEKWSRQAQPNASEVDLSEHRIAKLMRAIGKNSYLRDMMLIAKRNHRREDQYEELKEIAIQHDRDKNRRESGGGRKKGFGPPKGRNDDSPGKEKSENQGDQGETHESRESSGDVRNSGWKDKSDVKCFECGQMGHISYDCPSKSIRSVTIEEKSAKSDSTEWCEILGQRRRVTIDSGAAVSALTTKAWNRLRNGCAGWQNQCVISGAPKFVLKDAQMKVIPVNGQVQTAVKVKGRMALVTFQILENERELFIIGTDAFRDLGVALHWYSKPEANVSSTWKSCTQPHDKRKHAAQFQVDYPEGRKHVTEKKVMVDKRVSPVGSDRVLIKNPAEKILVREKSGKRARPGKDAGKANAENIHLISAEIIPSSCRVLVDGCDCEGGRCSVFEHGMKCESAEQLAVCLLGKKRGVPVSEIRLATMSAELKVMVTEEERKEAVKRFAMNCSRVAMMVMSEQREKSEWSGILKEIRDEATAKWKPRQVTMKSGLVIVTPDAKVKGPGTYNVRPSGLKNFHQTFNDEHAGAVMVLVKYTLDEEYNKDAKNMIKGFLEHGKQLAIVPGPMECNFEEVQHIYQDWKDTFAGVSVVNPMKSSEEKGRTPLILCSGVATRVELADYLISAVETNEEEIKEACGLDKEGQKSTCDSGSKKRARI